MVLSSSTVGVVNVVSIVRADRGSPYFGLGILVIPDYRCCHDANDNGGLQSEFTARH
jgi:hypothetical protein